MNVTGKLPHTARSIADLLKKLVALYMENAKFTAAEKMTVLLSAAVLLLISMVLGVIALAFLAGACIGLLELVLPGWGAYAIMCGFFILLIVLVFALRKSLIVNPIARFVSKLVFDRRDDGE